LHFVRRFFWRIARS